MSKPKVLITSILLAVIIIGLGFSYWFVQKQDPGALKDDYPDKKNMVKLCGDGICNNQERSIDCPEDCNKYFPNFNLPSTEFDQLLADIGVSREPTSDRDKILRRLQIILRWLAEYRMPQDKEDDCFAYVDKIKDYDGWESPEVLGEVYQKFNYICPGTCFSTSHTFSILVYKAGISEDDFQMIGRSITKNNENQHWWTRVKTAENEWLEIDPLCAETDTVLTTDQNFLCNREEIYHPCRYITPSGEGDINADSWHCIE